MVMLERGACRGRCPVYRVELYGNGKIQFDGKKFVDSLGIHTGTTSGASVRSLLATINTSDFGTMDTSYVMGSAACGSYMPDLPMSTVSAKIGATMKTVHYDPGCKNAPRSVQTLQKLIDSVAHTSAWTAVTGDSKK